MVNFSYQPWSKIVIHEIIEWKPEDLFALIIREALESGGVGITPSINWAEGVAFEISQFAESEEIVKEKLNGVVHYSSVEFARVPEHKPEVQMTVGGTYHRIRLDKADMNPIFVELARYLKQRPSIL